ncbi:conserved hypothetical protein [Methanocella arvoryzae MRE50]|uniref:Winged helix DNA-binding domain-containing protein n=1 Tax=Methanocella arvoryzae (strain DSM 22066 / NBRC 105507 / MRE50) TaxID=351160 RepID=Q0W5D0_METAR|nr:conserved hypothetical protein [Methanocella arvoryzae MRE50]
MSVHEDTTVNSEPAHLSPEEVRWQRLHAQHLDVKAPVDRLVEVVRSLCGANAQSRQAMMLSLRARIGGLEPAYVNKALEEKRLVRTWAMRGTLHLVDPQDLNWIVPLLGPGLIKKGMGRRLELGLDEKKVALGLEEIRDILREEGSLTRSELVEMLNERGVDIDPKSQAPYHLLARAALEGIVGIGPENDEGKQTFYLVADPGAIRKRMSDEEWQAELARRYLPGYGPASLKDFTSWSGQSVSRAKRGWDILRENGTIMPVTVEGQVLWSLRTQDEHSDKLAVSGTVVNLLPAFDPYVLGYDDRRYLVPESYHGEVYHGGQTVPVVLIDGLVAGVWRYERSGKRLDLKIKPFKPFDHTIRRLVAEEAEDTGRFLSQSPSVVYIK